MRFALLGHCSGRSVRQRIGRQQRSNRICRRLGRYAICPSVQLPVTTVSHKRWRLQNLADMYEARKDAAKRLEPLEKLVDIFRRLVALSCALHSRG